MPREGIGPLEAIAAIRSAGGLPVARPLLRGGRHGSTVVRELRDAGLGGLEVYYRTFDRATQASVLAVADELALVPTGGTDYHGDIGPYAAAHAELWVPPEVGERLFAALGRSLPPATPRRVTAR